MKTPLRLFHALATAGSLLAATQAATAATHRIVGWNDLGMHCTDGSDFSVFSILPHYNTIHAQVIRDGKLLRDTTGYVVTYEAVADPDASKNQSSAGKGNFYTYVKSLYGPALQPDQGLAGFSMPGPKNTPQKMRFDSGPAQFTAEGIPITPYDDQGKKNYYPMMRLSARDKTGMVVASTDIVLPVSDEMDCRVCHASGSQAAAMPVAGWVKHADAAKDFKLNILKLHDERHAGDAKFAAALAKAGYGADGLLASATLHSKPVLCAHCHGSNALPGTGVDGVSPLTRAIHGYHAHVTDPVSLQPMDHAQSRASCYRCHPGSETRCLRGAMGSAVAADGSMAMQCQSCHGGMSQVGSDRVGWLDQPDCANCHSGTATRNSGQIRFASVFEANGSRRQPADRTFAANTNTPAAGFALYRFSKGHGNLQCEACHGPTHAEVPSSHRNDNLQNIRLQGHVGTLIECSTCHASVPSTVNGGPHGMHPVGQSWVDKHGDAVERSGSAQCQACHGTDYRGTVLSRSHANRTLKAFDSTRTFFRGSRIGCYNCHQGPSKDDRNSNRAPTANSITASTTAGTPVAMILVASDPEKRPLTLRIVSQPQHGTVAFDGKTAVYYPEAGFAGTDTFTFAAWDGSTDSNLATGTVRVTAQPAGATKPAAIIEPLDGLVLKATPDEVTLYWPGELGQDATEAMPALDGAEWAPLGGTPALEEGRWVIRIQGPEALGFFRLRLQ